jgi:chromosome partitioning protein
MPIIPFVSPKGGTGKSTSALLLATFLAKLNDVTVIDADPNQPIKDWASGGRAPPRLTVVSDVEEDTILEHIEDAAAKTPFVIVDLEGTASKIVLYAISQADFVVVPMQASYEDAKAASRAVRVIRQSERMTRQSKPFAVLLTGTSPMIRPRGLAHIQKGLIDAGVPILKTELNERDAFKAIFSFQQTLDELDPGAVPNLDRAKVNVAQFAEEVIARILAEQGGRKADVSTEDMMEGAA